MTFDSPVLTAQRLSRRYGPAHAAGSVTALSEVTAAFAPGKFHVIVGVSGSGKSTLLHCLAGIDQPTSGQVILGDVDLGRLRDSKRAALRRRSIGFVFQRFNLLPTLTAEENILLPLTLSGARPDHSWVRELIETLGLASLVHRHPEQLSGGQQQRVALARALAGRPAVVLADEPTGSLDSESAGEVITLLERVASSMNRTVIVATHDAKVASAADQLIQLRDGRVSDRRALNSHVRPVQAG
jgi:putative ABC transport system ATP-binding protein